MINALSVVVLFSLLLFAMAPLSSASPWDGDLERGKPDETDEPEEPEELEMPDEPDEPEETDEPGEPDEPDEPEAVSYTHLDVYKRQIYTRPADMAVKE